MDKSFYFGYFPVVIILVVFSYIILSMFIKELRGQTKKLFLKVFLSSIVIISTFSLLYFMLLLVDISSIPNGDLKNIKEYFASDSRFFTGITPGDFNHGYIFIDLFIYSASVFFGFNHHIQIVGLSQIVVMLERFLGLTMPLTIIFKSLIKKEKKDDYQLFFTYLNRNWDVLRTRKSDLGDFYVVELLNQDKEIANVYFKEVSGIKDYLRDFRVKWKKYDITYTPFFAKVLQEPFFDADSPLYTESLEYFHRRSKINEEEYYIRYYDFLKRARNEKCIFESDILSQDFDDILSMIKEKYPNADLKNGVLE